MKRYDFEGHKLAYHTGRVNQFLESGDCFPLYLEISPVGSCNHRCLFCAYDFIGYPNRKLESARALKLIDELAQAGLKSLLFAGEGEPLLHPELDTLIRHAKGNGIDVGLFTNGQLLTPELAERILPSLSFIRFSFNGGDQTAYSRVHQVKPEAFTKVTAAIRNAVSVRDACAQGTSVGAQFVLIPENMASLSAAAELLKKAGVDYLAIKPFIQQSDQQCYRLDTPIPPAALEECLRAAQRLTDGKFKVMARSGAFANHGERGYDHCYGSAFITVINSAGDLASCLPYWDNADFVFGNIYQNSFEEIWHGSRRRNIKEKLECHQQTGLCPPNCRPNAINEFLYEVKHPSLEHLNFI
jgi:GTP 3',8-cyclase